MCHWTHGRKYKTSAAHRSLWRAFLARSCRSTLASSRLLLTHKWKDFFFYEHCKFLQISTQDISREPWPIRQRAAAVSATTASITTPSTCLIKGRVKEAAADMNPKRQRVPSDPNYSHKRWQSFGDVRISRARLWKRNPLCLLRPPSSSSSSL